MNWNNILIGLGFIVFGLIMYVYDSENKDKRDKGYGDTLLLSGIWGSIMAGILLIIYALLN